MSATPEPGKTTAHAPPPPSGDERLQFVLACSGLGYWEWAPLTGEMQLDARCCVLLGLDERTVEPRIEFLRTLVHPDDYARIGAATTAHRAGLTPVFAVEHRLRHRNGDWIRVLNRGVIIERDATGVARRICGTVRTLGDEASRTVAASPLSEQLFARIFHNSPVMMGLHRVADGVLIEANEALLQTLGYTRAEVIGRRPTDVGWTTPDARDRIWSRLFKSSRVRELRVSLRSKSGAVVSTRYSGELLNLDGELYALSAWRDVTETRALEKQMRLRNAALEAAANAIVITDHTGSVVWANAATAQMSGYALPELLGHNLRERMRSGQHPKEFYAQMWETILAGRVWSGELTNRRKNGELYPEEMTITPIRGLAGAITHFIAVKQDISERRNLQRQFLQAQKMEAVGQLAGGVAHDFNNILAAMMLHIGLADADPGVTPDLRQTLREFEKQIQRGAALTRQLLTFSRQEAMQRAALDANAVIVGLTKMLRRLIGEHIDIAFLPGPELPAIHADPGMVEQVITNLCVNARDAMPRGGRLELRTFVRAGAASPGTRPAGDFVGIAIADTGVGMDEATQRRVFEPFFTTKPVGKGTGLGLSTVYGIARQHGGWVELQSAIGAGSTFTVFFPVSAGPAAGGSLPASPAATGGGESVLLVEDDAMLRDLAMKSLLQLGYRAIPAGSGAEALSRWEEHQGRIDLLLTDMVMPGGINGLDLARQLRAKQPELKVVLCSGYSQQLAADGLAPDEAMELLRKPFGAATLAAVLARQFGRA